VTWLEDATELAVPVAIASSSPEEWVESHLIRLGIREAFQTLVCAGRRVPAKPDPTCYLIGCKQLGADPVHSVAVEDSPHGVVAATAAGLYTVAVPHPLTVDLDLSLADRIVDSLEQIALADALSAAAERSTPF
jgi:beta-phosphoglucomutase-like phosphatase (HAD superfamily)